MSEIINNREKRRQILKKLILELHEGADFDEIKNRFESQFSSVSAKEISDMEQDLIRDGMPVESIQKLCDVHAAVFKGSIEDIHKEESDEKIPGHPVHSFLLENRELEKRIDLVQAAMTNNDRDSLSRHLADLMEIDKHYSRKENLIFPMLEKHDITGPPKVMWSIDDEVRSELKELIASIASGKNIDGDDNLKGTLKKIKEMIFKEDNILVPMILETFSIKEWIDIKNSSDEIGFSYIEVGDEWKPAVGTAGVLSKPASSGSVNLGAGALTNTELRRILNTLPVDITFVDADDKVKYFSEGTERIFPRPRTIIGREVSNCHPPASVHIVEQLVSDLKSGKKDNEDFWIRMGDKFVYIRYFAVRDHDGSYLGTLEFTQNIKTITELEGEKRLVT
jgi:DUF438 domain-containing protein